MVVLQTFMFWTENSSDLLEIRTNVLKYWICYQHQQRFESNLSDIRPCFRSCNTVTSMFLKLSCFRGLKTWTHVEEYHHFDSYVESEISQTIICWYFNHAGSLCSKKTCIHRLFYKIWFDEWICIGLLLLLLLFCNILIALPRCMIRPRFIP